MDEELANALLNDMDFEKYGKVMCSKIEQMLPEPDNAFAKDAIPKLKVLGYEDMVEQKARKIIVKFE